MFDRPSSYVLYFLAFVPLAALLYFAAKIAGWEINTTFLCVQIPLMVVQIAAMVWLAIRAVKDDI